MNRKIAMMALAATMGAAGTRAMSATDEVVVLDDGEGERYKPPKRQARSIQLPPQERKEKSSGLKRMLNRKGRV